ncbi:hypothetical protein LI153_12670, partial [Blautia marasmi]|nr:hypothetical protein [Blautia marasmi]
QAILVISVYLFPSDGSAYLSPSVSVHISSSFRSSHKPQEPVNIITELYLLHNLPLPLFFIQLLLHSEFRQRLPIGLI